MAMREHKLFLARPSFLCPHSLNIWTAFFFSFCNKALSLVLMHWLISVDKDQLKYCIFHASPPYIDVVLFIQSSQDGQRG